MKETYKIISKYSQQYFKAVTNGINYSSQRNIGEKNIIICSTAQKAISLQEKLDAYLDRNESIKGDSIVVIGNQETELKYAYTTAFTNLEFATVESISSTKLCPKFLIGTLGCIGAGLDCDYVQLVTRIGFPTSIIDFIQEMGRCGRQQSHHNDHNAFAIIFTLNDYV